VDDPRRVECRMVVRDRNGSVNRRVSKSRQSSR
jgi:hypothetical protein